MTDSTDGDRATVLVVDDEERVADLYADFLASEYDTETAYSGAEALERVGPDVDVVVLDRRMPDTTGGAVLRELRDRGLDVGVVMVTAVDPTESDMDLPFDEYLVKPVDADTLSGTIERLLTVREYDEVFREYLTVTSKMTLMEAQLSPGALADSEAYATLSAEADRLEAQLREEREDTDDLIDWLRGTDKLDGAF